MKNHKNNSRVRSLIIPLNLAIVAAARAIGSKLCPGDPTSRYFVLNSFLYPMVYLCDILGFPLRHLVAARSFLVYEKLWQSLQSEFPPEIIIHVSGGFSTHLLNLVAEDLQRNKKLTRKYVLTDLSTSLQAHLVASSRFFKKSVGHSSPVLYLEYDVFKHDLVQILEDHQVAFKHKKVLILLEGFWYYLPLESRIRLLDQITKVLSPQRGFLITDFQSDDFSVLLQKRNLKGWRRLRNSVATFIAKKLTGEESTYSLEKDNFETIFNLLGFLVVENSITSNSSKLFPIHLVFNLDLVSFPPLAFNVYLFQFYSEKILTKTKL
ncbi:MAG: hypothetical protein ACFFC7_31560 [Candidatus Hermodarchaeota archaeon]